MGSGAGALGIAAGARGSGAGSSLPDLRVGVDLVAISEVRDAVTLHGDRYLRRVFTDDELSACQAGGRTRYESLAARFAAKEAAVKALRPTDGGPGWKDVEVRRLGNGACTLELHGAAAALASDAGIDRLAVSMTHEGDMAAAVVIGWSS
jgi:holo-[acyl-carrier protein] synthase